MSYSFSRRALRSTQATSLVETAIAIGIFAFAFLTIWGALNSGANSWRQSKDVSLASEIQQQLFAKAAEAGSNLPLLTNSVYYLDGEGLALQGEDTNLWAYQARLLTPVKAAVPGGSANTNLLRLSVEVRPRRGEPVIAHRYFSSLISQP